MKIWGCGTLVTTKLGAIEGMITCSNIAFNKVTYEITYYNASMDKKTVWANEEEFSVTKGKRIVIGFHF